ncbi:hypothetical protein [Actinomadura algeriensis]|uniref:Uncharacterized protein n=1 Tax=Actinomadura algeriensis TaxID=1679523 RepID=A0ABR9K3I8_9ACTN|nr:hypothetical protein [Actinomadura algeriensis]MBE1536910.1 hypothetical protein [Actinomadura algeriensis]
MGEQPRVVGDGLHGRGVEAALDQELASGLEGAAADAVVAGPPPAAGLLGPDGDRSPPPEQIYRRELFYPAVVVGSGFRMDMTGGSRWVRG